MVWWPRVNTKPTVPTSQTAAIEDGSYDGTWHLLETHHCIESRHWLPGNNLHSAAMSSRGPNSYDVGYVHILGHEERTHPLHENSKKFYPPTNKQTSWQKDWESGFQPNRTGSITQEDIWHKKEAWFQPCKINHTIPSQSICHYDFCNRQQDWRKMRRNIYSQTANLWAKYLTITM